MRSRKRKLRRTRNICLLFSVLIFAVWEVSRNWEIRWTSRDALTTWFASEGRVTAVRWLPENSKQFPPIEYPYYYPPGWGYSPSSPNTKLWTQVFSNNNQAVIFEVLDVSPYLVSPGCPFAIATLFAIALIITIRSRRPPPPAH